jgi:hypothetical protein
MGMKHQVPPGEEKENEALVRQRRKVCAALENENREWQNS